MNVSRSGIGVAVTRTDATLEELTLEELAVRAQANRGSGAEDEYFSELVTRLHGRLSSFLLRKTGRAQDVDDLVQETFLRAYANLERYQPRWQFTTWLYTIASRLAANQHRSRKRAPRALPAELAAGDASAMVRGATASELSSDPATLLAEHQEGVTLWATAKSKLNDAQYTVIWLHYAQDMSVKDIATRTGKTALHVRVLLYRARRKLAKEVVCSVP